MFRYSAPPALLISLSLVACASNPTKQSKSQDLLAVEPQAARSVLEHDDAIARVAYRGLSNGESKWLELYRRVRPVSDAGTSEALDSAFGQAIAHSPADSIQVLSEMLNLNTVRGSHDFYLTEVCGGTSLDSEGVETPAEIAIATRQLNARILALDSLSLDHFELVKACKAKAKEGLVRVLKKIHPANGLIERSSASEKITSAKLQSPTQR